jgi:hypothetical protein
VFTLYITAYLLLLVGKSRFQGRVPHVQGFADELLLLGSQMIPAGGGHGQAVQVQTLRPPGLELGVRPLQGLEAQAQVQERGLLS